MGVLIHKIFHDLWAQKGRTTLVVLIIALGTFAIGAIMGTRDLVIPAMQNGWSASNPAMINLFINPPINEQELEVLKHVDGVVDIDTMNNATIEWRLSPTDEWKSGGLNARADYHDQKLNKIDLVEEPWPKEEVVSIGQGDDGFFKLPKHGKIYIRYDDRVHTVQIDGVVYNQLVQPATFGGTAQFYASQDYYEKIIGNADFGQVLVTAAQYDEAKVTDLADRMQDVLDKQQKTYFRLITDPNKHFFQDQMDGIFFLLGVLGALALALGLLLVYNTINAIISQQVDQIGIMKAIGARTGQILRMYLANIFVYSILSLLIALPLGVSLAWIITKLLVGSFGANAGSFTYSPSAIALMVIIAILAPMLASMVPIFAGVRITVREAITTYGLATKPSLLDRLLTRIRRLSRMVQLTVSNTFRNKWRVFLMQITLVLSGLIFMMVISLRESVVYTVRDVLFSILNANITMVFDDPQRIDRIEALTLAYPGIKAVEMWGGASATVRPRGQKATDDDEDIGLLGGPLPTQAYGYQLRAGRWLDPSDSYAIVLNQKQAKDIGVGVGDWVTVKYGEKKERDWQVVGLVFDPIQTSSAGVPREVLLRDIGEVGRAQSVWILTEQEGLQPEVAIAKGLRDYYKQNGIKVSLQPFFGIGGDSTTETGNAFINQFNFIIYLLNFMVAIFGGVGMISLSGAISLSVIERRREIGVMRAIGASSGSISRLFIGEGLILGWLSWLIALPLSIPAGRLMVQALGLALQLEMVYKYTLRGALLWFVIITVLSIIASWLPARGATRISVRETLAYQ